MSYTRDMDGYTRGIGAIQAIDKVKSRRRARLELERHRALARTDAKKVKLMGLGAINLTGRADTLVRHRTTANPPYEGGDVGPGAGTGTIMPPMPGGRGGAPTPPGTGGRGGNWSFASAVPRVGSTRLVASGPTGPRQSAPGSGFDTGLGPGPTNVLVPPTPTSSSGGATSGSGTLSPGGDASGGSSGGGGGGGGGGAAVGPPMPGDPGDTTPAPNLDLESAGGIKAFVAAHKTLLILAALGIGAYAYSKRKKAA